MKAYLINLDRSPDRLLQMQSQFGRLGIAFERFAAVDAAAMSQDELANFARARTGIMASPWLPGEVGVFLSHFAIWRLVAEQDDRAAAIFEDDLNLAADLKPLLASSDWIPADADLVRLEANRKMLLRGGRRIGIAPERRLFRAESGTWGAAAYIVTKDAAGRLVESDPALHRQADNFLFKPGLSPIARSLRRYQVVPAVCVQKQLVSDGSGAPESLIGSDGRRPKPMAEKRFDIASLLPWKKRRVPFRP